MNIFERCLHPDPGSNFKHDPDIYMTGQVKGPFHSAVNKKYFSLSIENNCFTG
jgi:hypothetical protein